MKFLLAAILALINTNALAQQQTFDIVTYTPLKGWKENPQQDLKAYSITDKTKGSWGQIGIYRSIASKGSIEKDFESEWNELAVKQYKATDLQENAVVTAGDWKIKVGGGKFKFNNADAIVLLTTITGYNVCVSILSTTNSTDYVTDIQNFLETVDLKKPEGNIAKNNPVTQNSNSVKSGNFAYSTTNFDDGWVSTIKNDWVEVTKGDIKVYLWYGLPFNASDFNGTGLVERDYFWDNYVSKYFTIQTKQYKDKGETIGSLKPKYVEGLAIDKQTGQKRFIGMQVVFAPNTAFITIASANDEAALWQQFPNANGSAFSTSDLSNMSGYNKFAIGANDLIGTWSDHGGNTMNWYSTTTGENVGATGAVTSDEFTFINSNSYTSTHKGASGVIGAMKTYQQEYKGTYTINNWTVTATNRFKGQTEVYNGWFEIVRGGRVLHLQNVKYTADHVKLVKTK